MSEFTQPNDFRDESRALYALIKDLSDEDLLAPTAFKGWTINDVITHLHTWNWAADKSLSAPDQFDAFLKDVMGSVNGGLRGFEEKWIGDLKGRALVSSWVEYFEPMAERFAAADPKARLKWAGPDMSARSSITARLMETWAHGQEVYDTLGVVRQDGDRIQNIAILGLNTFGFNFKINKLDVPDEKPYLKLTAPSGAVWEWGDASNENKIEGAATQFCQVVTQTRNVADTDLNVSGPVATQWMAIAQCFAGPPETPPAPGVRHTVQK